VAWSFSSLPPYPVVIVFVGVFSFVGLLLSTTTSNNRMSGGVVENEHTKINTFFGKFAATNKAGESGEDGGGDGGVESITSSGNYFDAKLPMDGKIRFDKEGKGSAIFPPPFESSHASNIIALPVGLSS
jgi:hypothetical protein